MRAVWASPLGFLIGVSLGALGGGGSILAVPVLVFVVGQEPSTATSTSLAVVGVAALIGAYGHWRSGRVRVGPGLAFGLVGAGGSLAGSALNRRLDGDVLLMAFSVLILVAAWRITAGCPSCTRAGEDEAVTPTGEEGTVGLRARALTAPVLAKLAAAGSGVGFLTGLFGVGGGFVVVPALALLLGYSMPTAVGTSLLVVAVNSAVGLVARLGSGGVDWMVTLAFTAAAIAGVAAGKKIADRIAAATMQRAFAWMLVAVALYTGIRGALSQW